LTHNDEVLTLYQELKLVEAESLRVAVTIDALEEELHEDQTPENIELLHSRLGHLYKYDIRLASLYINLDEAWRHLQNPERKPALTVFSADQSKPIPNIHEGLYGRLPGDAIPVTTLPLSISNISTMGNDVAKPTQGQPQ
jgi:hypothetical protein